MTSSQQNHFYEEFWADLERDRLQALEGYLERYPECANVVRAAYADAQNDDDVPAVVGRYKVLGELGRGGVGTVYRGRDTELGRDVALKFLHAKYRDNAKLRQRFVEEAQVGGQLQHPGVAPVYEMSGGESEEPFFSMKLIKGRTLAKLLAERESPASNRRRFLAIFEAVCQTMAYAHARRVIHRDLKPANVMIGAFGEVQVVDWGMGKVLPRERVELENDSTTTELSSIETVRRVDGSDPSVPGSVMGTLAYMPPEQALGQVDKVDERADVFALGAMLCEVLTGQPPYLGDREEVHLQAAGGKTEGALRRLAECGADAELVALCHACLEPTRKARPDSAEQVADAIAQHLSSVEERARQAEIRAAEAKVKARATVLLAGAVVLILAIAGGGYLWFESEEQQRQHDAEQRVARAMTETNVMLGEARADDANDLAQWERAVGPAERASALAASPDVGEKVKDRVAAMLRIVREEEAASKAAFARKARNSRMRQRIVDARTNVGVRINSPRFREDERRRIDAAHRAAFKEYLHGRDLLTLPTGEARKALEQGGIPEELLPVLHNWIGVLDLQDPVQKSRADRIIDIANGVGQGSYFAGLQRKHRYDGKKIAQEADLTKLSTNAKIWLARAQGMQGGIELYRRIHELQPDDGGICFDLAMNLLIAGDNNAAEAEQFFVIARALRPDIASIHHFLGVARDKQRKHESALRSYHRALQLRPNFASTIWCIGKIHDERGEAELARKAFERALAADPDHADSLFALGRIHRKAGQAKVAMDYFQRALRSDPDHAETHTNVGLVYKAQGNRDLAIRSYRRAVKAKPGLAAAHHNLGNLLMIQGRYELALTSLRRSLRLDPKPPLTHANLGAALTQTGRLDEAIERTRHAYEAWSRQQPKGKTKGRVQLAQRTLAYFKSLRNRAEAIIAGRVARPGPADRCLAAGLLHERGEPGKALQQYERLFEEKSDWQRYPFRFRAACAAAAAGGSKQNATARDLRNKARVWLAADIEMLQQQKRLDALVIWLEAPEFKAVRHDKAVARLPVDEREPWRALWKRVASLLEESRK